MRGQEEDGAGRAPHCVLPRLEVDALVLRHKMGLPSQQAGYAVGLAEADSELLHSRAVVSFGQ